MKLYKIEIVKPVENMSCLSQKANILTKLTDPYYLSVFKITLEMKIEVVLNFLCVEVEISYQFQTVIALNCC